MYFKGFQKSVIVLSFVMSMTLTLCSASNASTTANNIQHSNAAKTYIPPLSIVNSPKTYLGKTISMKAKFDKFSTLGLDYKPAMRSSEKYISFLIKRDDTIHNIPLSEMKLFIKREVAEKHIDLKTGDEIAITGTVFSDALGDPWIDVQEISIIKKAPDKNGV